MAASPSIALVSSSLSFSPSDAPLADPLCSFFGTTRTTSRPRRASSSRSSSISSSFLAIAGHARAGGSSLNASRYFARTRAYASISAASFAFTPALSSFAWSRTSPKTRSQNET